MTVKTLNGAKSPLGGASHGKQGDAVWMYEVPFTPMWDLRVEPGTDAFAAVNKALGLTLPTTVGDVARVNAACLGQPDFKEGQQGLIALCLGPDQWMLTGTANAMEILAPVRAAHHISIVDVSAQRTKLEVSGSASVEVLEHVWEHDLRDKHFGVDKCAQGIMFRTPVIMWHCCTDCYVLFVRASFAEHLWAVLKDATVEYI